MESTWLRNSANSKNQECATQLWRTFNPAEGIGMENAAAIVQLQGVIPCSWAIVIVIA
jgi:hypothetical protein